MIQSFNTINKVSGTLSLLGDKSISHRALLISSLANGKSYIKNISDSDDVKSTISCLHALGIVIKFNEKEFIVNGMGYKGYKKPVSPLESGNSGTTARLLTGILAAQNFESVITGDVSLSSRPMKRIIEPLDQMGAIIESDNGKLPLKIFPSENLRAINYNMPVASAQVKSAVLLAGLHLEAQTSVIESTPTRNHTENLLRLSIERVGTKIESFISRNNYPEPKEYFVPGDISSAMFFIVLALLAKNSELMIKDISLNTTRIKCLSILKSMGGKIQINERGLSNNEIFGDVIVKSSELANIHISNEIIPLIIDEIPILTIAGIFAEGVFELRGAAELRVKESDRIKAICINLLKLGLDVVEFDDGFSVSGKMKQISEPFDSFADHRIAMTFSILSSLLIDGGKVEGFESVSVSNPDFLKQLKSISS
ncbi:MAG TPA: 3-phosphoshikimate 1-carboxyvinyltransferase [Ignavibacteriaceae bacterium]|nr:3-phosphoshikimate 1-carboxyvinyltransferase [Ignavibacteriaceae bacterium]